MYLHTPNERPPLSQAKSFIHKGGLIRADRGGCIFQCICSHKNTFSEMNNLCKRINPHTPCWDKNLWNISAVEEKTTKSVTVRRFTTAFPTWPLPETLYHRNDALLYIAYVMLIWAAPIPADRWHCSLWP